MDDSIFTLEYGDSIPPLSKAARAGDLEKIKKLIAKGSLPHINDNRGWTAVHCCVAANQVKALKLILKLSSKSKEHLVNLMTWENITPLLIAVKAPKSSLEIVKILLKAGANPNHCTHTKLSPLHLACLKKGNLKLVKLLVEYGADVNLQEDLGLFTPLHFAISEACDLEVIKYLVNLSNLKLKNIYDRTTFLEACNSNFLEAVQVFLEKDNSLSNVNAGLPPLIYAGLLGNLEMVKVLIDSGADVNCKCKAFVQSKSDSDLILLDRENFLPIHSSLTNINVFKFLLDLTDVNKLLQLETSYYNFPLFVLIYGDEVFLETVLQTNLISDLKVFNIKVLVKFILSYPDMRDVILEKFPSILKYSFLFQPKDVLETLISMMSKEELVKNWKFLYVLILMGISSSLCLQAKNIIISAFQEVLVEYSDPENLINLAITSISNKVMTLKQCCRVVIRHLIRSSVKSDWLAVQRIKNLELPLCLRSFLLFESFS